MRGLENQEFVISRILDFVVWLDDAGGSGHDVGDSNFKLIVLFMFYRLHYHPCQCPCWSKQC